MYKTKYVNFDDDKTYFCSRSVDILASTVSIDDRKFISFCKLVTDPTNPNNKIPRKNLCVPIDIFKQIYHDFFNENDTNANKDK